MEIEDTYNHITYETLLNAIDHIPDLKIRKWLDEDVAFLLKTMYWSGLRPSEAVKLKKEDFHLNTRTIFLGKTKTKEAGDTAIIPVFFIDETKAYIQQKEDGQLLPGLKYKPLWTWLKKLGEMLDIPAWNTPRSESKEMTVGHGLRKSVGKNLIAGKHLQPNGERFSIMDVSQLLRHKKVSMTEEHYLKVTQEALKRKY